MPTFSELLTALPAITPSMQVTLVFLGMLFLCLRLASSNHEITTLLAQALAKTTPPPATPQPDQPPTQPTKPPPQPIQPTPPQPAPAPAPEPPAGPPVSIHHSPQIEALKAKNAERWSKMHVRADKIAAFDRTAAKLCAPEAKARYQKISEGTQKEAPGLAGVPWYVIALIHEREASGNFNAQLGQGDPLDQVSTHVPTHRGPFFNHPNDPPGEDAFYRSALDALTACPPFASEWKDWSIGGLLTLLEEYNGLGYANRGVPSAYVWSGSDQYEHGKFVADHVYSESAVDVQEGCAPLLSRMMAIDHTIGS